VTNLNTGLSTGLPALDRVLRGLIPGDILKQRVLVYITDGAAPAELSERT